MSSALRIAVAQVHPPTADVAGALARLRWLLAAVRAAGAADLLVLPECWLQAYHLRPLFLLGTKAIVPGEVRDRPRSWAYVKTREREARSIHDQTTT